MSGGTFPAKEQGSRISSRIPAKRRTVVAGDIRGPAQPSTSKPSAFLSVLPCCADGRDFPSHGLLSRGQQRPRMEHSTTREVTSDKNYPWITLQPKVVLCDIIQNSLHCSCRSVLLHDLNHVRFHFTPAKRMPELNDHHKDSDSCQRARPYLGKVRATCARTYMPWPFEKKRSASIPTDCLSLEPFSASPQNERPPFCNQTNGFAAEGADQVSCQDGSEEVTGHIKGEAECLDHAKESQFEVPLAYLDGAQTSVFSTCSYTEEQTSWPGEDLPTSEALCSIRNEATTDCYGQSCVLDEVTAYEQDILIVNVIQDDLDLCDDFPQSGWIKNNPARVEEASEKPGLRLVEEHHFNTSLQVHTSPGRQTNRSESSLHVKSLNLNMIHTNSNNNERFQGDQESVQLSQTSPSLSMPKVSGPHTTLHVMSPDLVQQQKQSSHEYCRLFFSQSLTCNLKTCRFPHVPLNGDELFCIESVERFTQNPGCLQKAGAVFRGYYQNNAPGLNFSLKTFNSLLLSLLKEGMVTEILAVLGVSLEYKIVPKHAFMLALFTYVREKCLSNLTPELVQITYKMVKVGLVLNVDCFNYIKNIPEFHQMASPSSSIFMSGNHMSNVGSTFADEVAMASTIVEIELFSKLGNWKQLGELFRFICYSNSSCNKLETIGVRIAMVLLYDRKEQTLLPFVDFAKTVCQNENEDSPAMYFLGRIGVTLMLRYHNIHQWHKGQSVVEVLSLSKINYSMLKGLFVNHNGESRCSLVTVAAKLFLLSGSVEGAMSTLKENKWFVTSHQWPCSSADLENRSYLMIKLSQKISCRDRLEVLSNLPGIKEPIDLVDVSKYTAFFVAHLKFCMEKRLLVVASDTIDFMFSKSLLVEHAFLQQLLCKLVEQNKWLRARQVFKHSLCMGHYSGASAPPGLMTLVLPWDLQEVEFALLFEKFIAVNGLDVLSPASSVLTIILQRNLSSESEYLNASSRLMSAAGLLMPRIHVRYTEVNSLQEQVFALDIVSARNWLRNNNLWTKDLWTQ